MNGFERLKERYGLAHLRNLTEMERGDVLGEQLFNDLVYLIIPYDGDMERYRERAKKACAAAFRRGEIPVVPRLMVADLFAEMGKEDAEEAIGIYAAMFADRCDRYRVCGGELNMDTVREVDLAAGFGMFLDDSLTEKAEEAEKDE